MKFSDLSVVGPCLSPAVPQCVYRGVFPGQYGAVPADLYQRGGVEERWSQDIQEVEHDWIISADDYLSGEILKLYFSIPFLHILVWEILIFFLAFLFCTFLLVKFSNFYVAFLIYTFSLWTFSNWNSWSTPSNWCTYQNWCTILYISNNVSFLLCDPLMT